MQESYAPPIRETPKVIWLMSLLDLTGVMFAFFILMFSMSTFEDVKTNAVRASLNSAFASVVPPNTEATTFTSTSMMPTTPKAAVAATNNPAVGAARKSCSSSSVPSSSC